MEAPRALHTFEDRLILVKELPLPLIPLMVFTRDKKMMREFVNKRITTILALISAIIIIGLNAYLLVMSG
jgi:manganese transport protein